MQQLAQPKLEGFKSLFKSFLEAGWRSLALASGLRLADSQEDDLVQNEWPLELLERVRELDVSAIKIPVENSVERQVVAIDTSSIIVAAGGGGVAVGLRGSVVVRNLIGVEVQRVGPFIAYLTPDNLPEILGSILGNSTPLDFCDYQLDQSIQKILAGLLEKRIQEYVVERFRDSIILLDGSLSAGPLDNPLWLVSRILEKAKPRGNDVLAFSKTSILQFWGEVFTDERLGVKPPYLIDMTWLIRSIELRVKVLGETYLAKLGSGMSAFRMDASTVRRVEEVLGSLLRSDPLIYGYPELLILAHDYCTFTKADVIALQSLLRRFGTEFFKASSIRDILFNPLDGGMRR